MATTLYPNGFDLNSEEYGSVMPTHENKYNLSGYYNNIFDTIPQTF